MIGLGLWPYPSVVAPPPPLPGSPRAGRDVLGNPLYPWEQPGYQEKPSGGSFEAIKAALFLARRRRQNRYAKENCREIVRILAIPHVRISASR